MAYLLDDRTTDSIQSFDLIHAARLVAACLPDTCTARLP